MRLMKNFVSILTALTVLLCCCPPYTALAADSEIGADSTAALAYGLLQYLGVFQSDGVYETFRDTAVSKLDFALYLSRVLKTGDTSAEAAANSLARMGVFDSDYAESGANTVSIDEMLVAAVKALGYKTEVWSRADYLKRARQLDLADGISSSAAAAGADCVILLYNTLHADTVYMGNDKIESQQTLLYASFGLKYMKGQITANAYTAIDGEATNDTGRVGVDGVLCRTDIEEIGEMLAYHAVMYYTETDGIKKIIYFMPEMAEKDITIDGDDIIGYDSHTIKYTDTATGKTKTLKLADNAAIIKNSKLVTTDYKGAFEIDGGRVTCISSSGVYKSVIIEEFKNYTVKAVDISKKILYTDKRDADGNVISINIGDSCVYVRIVTLPYLKAVNENTIQPEDVICLAVSDDGKIVRGYLCGEKVSGAVEQISGSGRDMKITVNSEEYKVDPHFAESFNLYPGLDGSFVIDCLGRIAGYSDAGAAAGFTIGYLYMLNFDDFSQAAKVKIYNVKRQHITAELEESVKLNGVKKSASAVRDILCSDSGGKLKRQLIGYKLSADGKITDIDLAADSKEERYRENMLYTQLPKGSYQWYYQMKSFDRRYVLSGNTYYMRVPDNEEDLNDATMFGCQTFSNVTWYNSNIVRSILGLYKYDDSTPFADLLLVKSSDSSALTNQTEVTMVSSVTDEVGPGGSVVTGIHGYRRGVEVTAYIESDKYRNDVETGDLIRFATDVRGYVADYEIVYDLSEDKVLWAADGTGNPYTSNATASAGLRYTFGYVNRLYIAPYTTGLNSVIEIGSTPGVTEDIWQVNGSTTATTRFIVYDSSRREDKVYMAHLDEIVSWEDCQNPDAVSRVFVHTRSGWLIAIMIYK